MKRILRAMRAYFHNDHLARAAYAARAQDEGFVTHA